MKKGKKNNFIRVYYFIYRLTFSVIIYGLRVDVLSTWFSSFFFFFFFLKTHIENKVNNYGVHLLNCKKKHS